MWIGISGLFIEYYDNRVLAFIGDHIGKIGKVDKNTFTRERGAYTRLFIQVDINKSLLAMFSVKGRHYKVEYEGLHISCLGCGRYGYHAEVCREKKAVTLVEEGEKEETSKGDINNESKKLMETLGHWSIIQKTRKTMHSKQVTSKDWQVDHANNTLVKYATIMLECNKRDRDSLHLKRD